MKRILWLTAMTIFTLGLPFTANAQEKIKSTKSPSKPITTQTGMAEDGRNVLLNSDGTWKYSGNDKVVSVAPSKDIGTLSIETGIVLKSGAVKTVPRTNFYLLDKSFASIMIDSGFSSKDTSYPYMTFTLNFYNYKKLKGEAQDKLNSLFAALKPHVIQTVTTDFGGKATLNKLTAGKYWLMGFSTMNSSCMTWDLEANLISGNNALILDQNNLADFSEHCVMD